MRLWHHWLRIPEITLTLRLSVMLRCSRATASHSSDSFDTCVLLIREEDLILSSCQELAHCLREFKRSFGAKITINSKCIKYKMPVMLGKLHHTIFFSGEKKKKSHVFWVHILQSCSQNQLIRVQVKTKTKVKNMSKWVRDKTKMNVSENMVSDSVLRTTRLIYCILNQSTLRKDPPPLVNFVASDKACNSHGTRFSSSEKYIEEQRGNWQCSHRQDRAGYFRCETKSQLSNLVFFFRNSNNKYHFVAL